MLHALRRRVRVQPGGRIEIQDDALPEGADVEAIVLLTEAAGKPAPAKAGGASMRGGGGAGVPLPLDGLPTAAELDALPPLPLDQIFGIAPSGRTVEEIDRDLRALRDEWD